MMRIPRLSRRQYVWSSKGADRGANHLTSGTFRSFWRHATGGIYDLFGHPRDRPLRSVSAHLADASFLCYDIPDDKRSMWEGHATQCSASGQLATGRSPVMSSTVLERPTLVLNRNWQPVHVATVARSLTMLWNESAQVVDP